MKSRNWKSAVAILALVAGLLLALWPAGAQAQGVVWLGGGTGLAALPGVADDFSVQTVGPGQVPAGLSPSEWQTIQAQVAKLTAADGATGDGFGVSVSISGDTALIGALNADVGGNSKQGAVYVFYRDQGGPNAWGHVAKLTAADGAADDWFGFSVSVSGDTAIVGAFLADVGDNFNQGAAYVFYRDQGGPDAWGQVAKLTDGAAADLFGFSVSVSGDTAVVGAYRADVGSYKDQGATYVFDRNQGGPDIWGQVARLTAADGWAYDTFGYSVSVSGDTALVGALYADVGGQVEQGAAYVFYRNQGGADAWGQVAKLTAGDGAEGDRFGDSVSVSGDTAVVGAWLADVGGNEDQGAAYVFYRDQGGADAWGQAAKLTADDGAAGDAFCSVSVSGDTAIVGAALADVDSNPDQGAAYVFYRNQGGPDAWGQAAKLTADDGAAGDHFIDPSVSGGTAVVGASWAAVGGSEKQGAAYVFALPPVERVHLPADIKPGSCPNPLPLSAKGVLPVAILGFESFDTACIDPASVQLEGVAPLRWATEDVATPFEPYTGKTGAYDCTEVGPDGYVDLTIKFKAQEVVAALGEVSDGDVLVLSLTGLLTEDCGGLPFEGQDVVIILDKD
ncbi:MAG: FG-GAP repeat protein [Anaerolineae bacterium]|jgi:hypothetical protein